MAKTFGVLSALFGFLAVSTGAFGAHILEHAVDPAVLVTWNKGVQYMAMHAIPVYLSGLLVYWSNLKSAKLAGVFFSIGVFLFSGSLFLLVGTGVRSFGWITPFGGVSFLVGWVAFGIAAYTLMKEPSNQNK